MGDHFQNLVAPDVAPAQAKSQGDRLLSWLIADQIVSAETKDCVYGADLGYPPGQLYSKATGVADPYLMTLSVNGLRVVTKRTVFHCGQGGFQLHCSNCKSNLEPPDSWGDAVGEWYEQRGPGNLACPTCGVIRSIVEWQHNPPWAFGELGLVFWNWPMLTQAFIRECEEQLGSRLVHVYGKL